VEVLAHMSAVLAEAKRAGEPFKAAWDRAIEALPEPPVAGTALPHREREAWRSALAATRAAWRRAFEDEPARELEHLVARMAA